MYYLGNEADANVTDTVVVVLFCKLWAEWFLSFTSVNFSAKRITSSLDGNGAHRARAKKLKAENCNSNESKLQLKRVKIENKNPMSQKLLFWLSQKLLFWSTKTWVTADKAEHIDNLWI